MSARPVRQYPPVTVVSYVATFLQNKHHEFILHVHWGPQNMPYFFPSNKSLTCKIEDSQEEGEVGC